MSRVQLALNVADLDASIDFYSRLFGSKPHKVRPGYANFAIEEPPLKLVLLQNDSRGTGTADALNHLGVEVDSPDQVAAASQRLAKEGLATNEETATVCCHAEQDKVWVADPAETPWEIYTILNDNPSELPLAETKATGCCTPTAGSSCS